MHPLNNALPGPYVPVQVTRSALVAHRYIYGSAASQQNLAVPEDFCSSLWNDFADPVFDGVGLHYFSLSLFPVYRLVLRGWGLRTDLVYITLSQPCTADLF